MTFFTSLFFFACQLTAAFADPPASSTGIPLDTAWKQRIFAYAQENVKHPSWGISHSERNYQVTMELSSLENLGADADVVFASAFLHDLGGIGTFEREGVDHAVRSVELVEPLLRQWEFPMEKWPAVREMILAHRYYAMPSATESRMSAAFRDADILDFLGAVGIARIFAITQEGPRPGVVLIPSLSILKRFADEMPGKLSSPAARHLAEPRVKEMRDFFGALNAQTFGERAL